MKNDEIEKLKKLIDRFDSGYYSQKNDELEKEIDNIIMGRPRLEGIRDRVRSDIVPESKKEKEIKKLRDEIKDNRKKARELQDALDTLVASSDKLEELVKQEILLDTFKRLLDFKDYSGLTKTDIYKDNEKKYLKLYFKSSKKITRPQLKISKEIYKLIKKNLKEYAYKTSKGYLSIERVFEDNKIKLVDEYAPMNKMRSDLKDVYVRTSNFDNIKDLGVDVDKIQLAREKIKGEVNYDSLTWQGKEAFDRLKNIDIAEKTNIETQVGDSKLTELKQKYNRILELARENWYVGEILSAFYNTDIIETEMYKGVKGLFEEQELEISKLTKEADKLYEKTGLENKIELIQKLEELYREAEELKLKIEQFQKEGSTRQAELIEQDYYKLRYNMIKILKDNPDLNKPKYNIDIKKYIQKEIEMFEPEIKKGEILEEKPLETSVIEQPNVETKKEEERTINIENLELDTNLQTFRTMHYQNYMREKVLNSHLGKISFSAYLETVAPNLIELINIEKEREKLARNVYKDYVKYFSSLENKDDAIGFHKFSEMNYGVSNIEVPVEYEEEYKGMRM